MPTRDQAVDVLCTLLVGLQLEPVVVGFLVVLDILVPESICQCLNVPH